MITINRTKFGLNIAEVFFAPSTQSVATRSAIQFFVQTQDPAPGLTPFKTQVTDLRHPADALFGRLSSNTRYKIRRAERDGPKPWTTVSPTPLEVADFSEYYDEFARQKSLSGSNRQKLNALREQDSLIITAMRDENGHAVCAHAYVRDHTLKRVRLLYSASHYRELSGSGDRNLVGRANRFLHWHEMTTFKQHGVELYDWGGLPIDDSDPVKNAIARFKLEFGGDQIIEYNGLVGTSLIGKALVACRRRLQ